MMRRMIMLILLAVSWSVCGSCVYPRIAESKAALSQSLGTQLAPKVGEGNENTYTITTIVTILKPCNPAEMNDPYQDVRVLMDGGDFYILEITYYPLDDNVRTERVKRFAKVNENILQTYLKPTITCNWDADMRKDLIAELRSSGIDPNQTHGPAFVKQVANWAMRRSRFIGSDSAMPICWYVYFPNGKVNVYPKLRTQFDAQKTDSSWTDQSMMESQILGKSMFYQKCHGACTSSSIYIATIFRALGIPTRILYFIPPCDGNDKNQVDMLITAIHHNRIHKDIQDGLQACGGFANHMYNEVYVEGHWVRLNYNVTDQNIVDPNYEGLLAHIDTCSDISETHLAETWGIRSADWPNVPIRLTSVNPYSLICAWDHFGKYAHIKNPPTPELTLVTINSVNWKGSEVYKQLIKDPRKLSAKDVPDMMINIKDNINGDYHQLGDYMSKAGNQFILHSPGHPDLHVQLNGLDCNNSKLQGFGANIIEADRAKIITGASYTIEPVNTSPIYRWTVAPNVKLLIPGN